MSSLRSKVDTLYDAIKHGNDEHKEWLKEAIDNHFKGHPVPEPRGQGNKEHLKAQLRELATAIVDANDNHGEWPCMCHSANECWYCEKLGEALDIYEENN